jgi:hypothetical protein
MARQVQQFYLSLLVCFSRSTPNYPKRDAPCIDFVLMPVLQFYHAKAGRYPRLY